MKVIHPFSQAPFPLYSGGYGIGPAKGVKHKSRRLGRAFGQQVGHFVLAAQEADR
jgi:hypothetical protein